MLILRDADVRSLLTADLAVEVVETGAMVYSAGLADIPVRARVVVPDAEGEVLFMPGHITGQRPTLGLKVITSFAGNPAKGLPGSWGAVLLLDPRTGIPEALVDAGYLTEVRTAAMTAVACKYLSNEGPLQLALVGTGIQAAAHVDLLAQTLKIVDARVWSRNAQRVSAFVQDARRRWPELQISACSTPEEAVEAADIIVAATTATRPVILADWIKPGAVVCGVGSHTPDAAEIDPMIVAGAGKIVVDTRRGTVDGAGDIRGPIEAGLIEASAVSELGELVSGRRPGRETAEEVAVFKSVGFAAIDLIAADRLVQAARSNGVGANVVYGLAGNTPQHGA